MEIKPELLVSHIYHKIAFISPGAPFDPHIMLVRDEEGTMIPVALTSIEMRYTRLETSFWRLQESKKDGPTVVQ
jgi:hypothetical protein